MQYTNILSLDSQHERLLVILSDMVTMSETLSGDDAYLLIPKLAIFTRHLERHFDHENGLMVKYDYEDVEQHMLTHATFLLSLKKVYADSMLNASIVKDMVKVIQEGVVTHINAECISFKDMIAIKQLSLAKAHENF